MCWTNLQGVALLVSHMFPPPWKSGGGVVKNHHHPCFCRRLGRNRGGAWLFFSAPPPRFLPWEGVPVALVSVTSLRSQSKLTSKLQDKLAAVQYYSLFSVTLQLKKIFMKISTSPAKISTSPAKISTSPAEISTSPAKISKSPAKITTSPAKISTSPAKISTSPTKISTSPAKISTSPAKISTSPAFSRKALLL